MYATTSRLAGRPGQQEGLGGVGMPRKQPVRGASSACPCGGFTLIELLVATSIIAVLISILLPALAKAREEGRKVSCMSNLKEVGSAISSWLMDNDNLPWTYVQEDGRCYPGINYYSSYTWGGMKAPLPLPGDESGDWAVVPPEVRALNRFLQPGAQRNDVIKVVQCPGDRSAVSPVVGSDGQDPPEIEGPRASWEAFGNSYSINWFFMEDPAITDPFTISTLMKHGKTVVQEVVGGSAAEFAVMWENQVDQLLANATENGGGHLGEGWHRRFSCHSLLFMDGHMEYRYFDTRFCRGPGWRIWR